MKTLKLFLFIAISFYFCKEAPSNNLSFTPKDSYLPEKTQIQQILNQKDFQEKYKAKSITLGYSSPVDWYQKVLQSISPEELDYYYNLNKKNLSSIELVSVYRKEIHERLAWKKIFEELEIKIYSQKQSQNFSTKNISLPTSYKFFLGSPNAKLKIIEYSDFQCYYCAKFQTVKKEILRKYGNQIQWIFKNFPLVDIHEEAYLAHISAGCVWNISPEKFWDYTYLLFENHKHLEKDLLPKYVQKLKINLELWKECMNDTNQRSQIISQIETEIEEGKKLRVQGTPTLIVGEKIYRGYLPLEVFEKIVKKNLK